MKSLITTAILCVTFFLTGCVSGNYISEPTGASTVTQAPMKLNFFRKARWTYYTTNNASTSMYYENARFKKRGDTIYMRPRSFYGDTIHSAKEFIPQYVVNGDSLLSVSFDLAYVKRHR